jgi:hypothetical protein
LKASINFGSSTGGGLCGDSTRKLGVLLAEGERINFPLLTGGACGYAWSATGRKLKTKALRFVRIDTAFR